MENVWRWEEGEGEIKMNPSPLVHGMRQTEELYTEKRRQGTFPGSQASMKMEQRMCKEHLAHSRNSVNACPFNAVEQLY